MNLMYADMGLTVLDSVAAYSSSKEQYKLEKSVQNYKNKMTALATAWALGTSTYNEARFTEADTLLQVDIQVQGMRDVAAFDVEAAAAGVIGNSVAAGRSDLLATEMRAQTSRARGARQQRIAFAQERKNLRIDSVFNEDVSTIRKPSALGAVLGTAAKLTDVWNEHNPESRTTTKALSK